MISTGVLYLIYGFLTLITTPIRGLPDVVLSSDFSSAVAQAGSVLHVLDAVVPVDALISVFGVYLLVELGIFTYKLIKWGYSKLPGVN